MKLDIPTKRFDDAFISFIQKYLNVIYFAIITIIGIILRNNFRGYLSGDMACCIQPWTEHLKNNGGFLGIKTLETNYSVMYQYFLAFISYFPGSTIAKAKVVNWVFDFLTAVFVGLFVAKLKNRPKFSFIPILAYTIAFFIPTGILNSSLWGQCDIIYTSLVLISVYLFTEDRFGWSFVVFGLALSFKLQAIFLLPLFIIFYIKTREFSIIHFLYLPIVYILVYLPAFLLGKPFSQIFREYTIQVGNYPSMVLNFTNLYALLPDDYELFAFPAILISLTALGFLGFMVISLEKLKLTGNKITELALIVSIVAVYFLPSMHERYMFMADFFAIIYLFIKPKHFFIPFIIWSINTMTYLPYLFGLQPWFDYRAIALILFGILIFMVHDFFNNNSHISE